MSLPDGNALSSGVQIQRIPSMTWGIQNGRIRGTVDGLEAVRQAVEIILNTERFRWQIYKPYSGVQLHTLIGQEPGYVAVELQRRIGEALSMDDRIHGISDFSHTIHEDSLTASMLVNTVYGSTPVTVEVKIT